MSENDAGALPSAAALRAYMTAAGWAEREPGGPAGSIWVKDGRRIGVPYDDHDAILIPGVVNRLAEAEGRTPAEVTRTVLAVYGAPGSAQAAREASPVVAAGQDQPAADVKPGARPGPVTEETVQALLAADVEWARQAHPAVWQSLDYDRARALLEAAAPLITAPLEAALAGARAAAASDRGRAKVAEERLAAVIGHCRGHLKLPGSCCPHLAQEILAILGSKEEDCA